MYKEIAQVKRVDELEVLLSKEPEHKIFTKKELVAVEKKHQVKSLGARYLIKKSIIEFLELDNAFCEIEIVNMENGKPYIQSTGEVKDRMASKNIKNIHISISHSRTFVSTLVVIE